MQWTGGLVGFKVSSELSEIEGNENGIWRDFRWFSGSIQSAIQVVAARPWRNSDEGALFVVKAQPGLIT